jgi:hypothetical protein
VTELQPDKPPPPPRDKETGDHDGDDGDGEHCHCGWQLPDAALPVMVVNLPEDADDLGDEHAIPGAICAIICPKCGCGHTFSVDPEPEPS